MDLPIECKIEMLVCCLKCFMLVLEAGRISSKFRILGEYNPKIVDFRF